MPDIAYMGLFYSGGAANTTPILSLGGAMSTVRANNEDPYSRIVGQRSQASGNGASCYHCFRFDSAAEMFAYAARQVPSSFTAGTNYDTGIGLLVAISDATPSVGTASLPTAGEGAGMGTGEMDDGSYVALRRIIGTNWPIPDVGSLNSSPIILDSQNIFDNVASSDAWNGIVDYRMAYLSNLARNGSDAQLPITPGQRFTKVKLWVDVQPGSAQIDLGWTIAELNTEPATLADRFTAPAGITFQDYDAETNAIELPVLDGLDQQPIWIRRTVFPMQSSADVTDDFFDIMWSAIG